MTTMNPGIYLRENHLKEERMAVQIVLTQLFLIFTIYAYFKSETQVPITSVDSGRSEIVTAAPTQPKSIRNIVDIIWSCQPGLILADRQNCTNKSAF